MPAQIVTIRETDFGAGLDTQSAVNQLQPGYVQEALNADPQPNGTISKRRGYQTYGGWLPLRVTRIRSNGTALDLVFDSAINMSSHKSTPIVVYGRSSNSTGGDITTTDSVHYYSTVDVDFRETFAVGAAQTLTIPAGAHGFSSNKLWVGIGQSTSEANATNSIVLPDSVAVDQATDDITLTYTNGTGSSFKGYVYVADKQTVVGESYFGDDLGVSGATAVLPSGGTSTYTLTAADHDIVTGRLIAKAFESVGGDWVEIMPDTVTVDKTTFQVVYTLTNNSGSSKDIAFSLSICPTENYASSAVGAGASHTETIDLSIYPSRTPFVFVGCYLDDGVNPISLVQPTSVVVDVVADTLSISFINGGGAAANFTVYWQFVPFSTNFLTVTQGSSATYTDESPQLTVWGLEHDLLYLPGTRGGWVTHIDSYRAAAENKLVAGLGGNLYATGEYSSAAATYLLPSLYPRLQAVLAADTNIGPVFWETGEIPALTRGYITGSMFEDQDHEVAINAVAWDSGTGWVKYTLMIPNMSVVGALGTIINTGSLPDSLEVAGASYQIHNGRFEIRQAVAASASTLEIYVDNPRVNSADWDIAGSGGYAGISSDAITFLTGSPFIPGDRIRTDLFSDDADTILCFGSSSTTARVYGLTDKMSVPAGLIFLADRTSAVVPLRTTAGVAAVTNLVRGDMLQYGDLSREIEVRHVNELADISVAIAAGNGTSAQVTMLSGDTSTLWAGEKVLIAFGAVYRGHVAEILSVDSGTTYTIASSYTDADSATQVGRTIHIDESLAISDSSTNEQAFYVARRWLPVEAPDDTYDLTPPTHTRYFESLGQDEQLFLRSVMVKDSLYLTNGQDELFKFDGVNLHRATLPRWNSHLFANVLEGATGSIVVGNPVVASTGWASNQFTLTTAADTALIEVGDRIKHSSSGEIYTVRQVQQVGGVGYVWVDRTISGVTAATSITKTTILRYYVRLNLVDANGSIIASAATGLADFQVELGANAVVVLRCVGLPVFGAYDYDRLEIEVFRTKGNTLSVFYKLATKKLSFSSGGGYVDIVDTTSDDDLLELDVLSTQIEGETVLTGLDAAPRAKYLTSSGNRLILANLTDYPTLDIQVLQRDVLLVASTFVADNFLFRKDNTDGGTTTDMVNRVKYDFRDVSTALTIAGITAPDTATIEIETTAPHGLAVGDWTYLFRTTNPVGGYYLDYAGWHQVHTVVSPTEFEFAWANAGVSAGPHVNRVLLAAAPEDVPVPIGADANYGTTNGNRAATGISYTFVAMRRLADAINASMRRTDAANISAMSGFEAWMAAYAGNDFRVGQLLVKQPRVFDTTMEVRLPTWTDRDFYVNDVQRSASASASARELVFPSRTIASVNNFPELFDAPAASSDSDSFSAIDVNPSDGQQLTSVIPFFGDSAFGAALQSGIVIGFKQNSIYLQDLNAKAAGSVAVQRLETQGKGCTFPYSVAVTRNGIMFANETGIYRLNRDMTIEYVGRKYEGRWRDDVDVQVSEVVGAGHHAAIDNQYKLSYVVDSEEAPSEVAVYNHVREYGEQAAGVGSWSTYTNHPAIGWANLQGGTYFASTHGIVFATRRAGDSTDYRDRHSAVDLQVTTRGMDFGDSGIRKMVRSIVSHYTALDADGTTLSLGRDFNSAYELSDAFVVSSTDSSGNAVDINTVQTNFQSDRGIYFQLKFQNDTIDEPFELTRVDWRVSGLSDRGITKAARTGE